MSSDDDVMDHEEIEGESETLANTEETKDENVEIEDNETETNNKDEENKQVVKPKKKIKNPQPKLNEQRLMGPRGLQALEGYFERVKFKGKGYEEQDLNVLMKTYEYWCHRLFPKYPFDSCIARLETLGSRKALLTNKKKIRMGVVDEDKPINSDEEVPPEESNGFVDEVVDPFDQLLPSENPTEVLAPKLTDDQLEQIQINKERAANIRRDKLLKIKEKSSVFLPVSNSQQSEDMFSQENLSASISNTNSHKDGTNVFTESIEKNVGVNENLSDSNFNNPEEGSNGTLERISDQQLENTNVTINNLATTQALETTNSVGDLDHENTDHCEKIKDVQEDLKNKSDDESEVDLNNILDIINVNNEQT